MQHQADGGYIQPAVVPVGARVLTSCLSMITISALAICLVRRLQCIQKWSRLPIVSWVILAIYVDSLLFIFSTSVLRGSWSLNDSTALCQAAILLCLACYMSTKILIYYFLVEKVYIIRATTKKRLKDKLWCFNVFGVILPFGVLVVVNFIYRIAYINESGMCIIGMDKKVLFPLIGFDAALNIWLTSLFLHPLYHLYSFKKNTNPALRTVAVRTFVGSCATLASSVVNLSVLAAIRGEPGWLCLMLCNLDILFSVLVLHWATSVDKQDTDRTTARYRTADNPTYGRQSDIRDIHDGTRHFSQHFVTITSAACPEGKHLDDVESAEETKVDRHSDVPSRASVLKETLEVPEKNITPVLSNEGKL